MLSEGNWQEFIGNNLGRLLGVAVGLLLGWMVIQYGLFKTLFVIIMVIAGYLLGKQVDEGRTLDTILNRIFRR